MPSAVCPVGVGATVTCKENQGRQPFDHANSMKLNMLESILVRTWPALARLALGLVIVPTFCQAATTNVVFQNYSYTPKTVTIQLGDSVVWTNASGFHTVTGDGADPFCGPGAIPTTCSETFTSAGTFPYHCVFHQSLGMGW